jgi:site-specific DNA-methyltransferase (adenine-specific)
MEHYYKDDFVTIYNGDSKIIVPQLGSFDLLLTDPPYGMSFQSNYRNQKHDKIFGDDQLDSEFINYLTRLAGCAAYVFCRWDNLRDMPKPKSVVVWVKDNWSMGDLKHEHGRQWEACCFYPGKRHEFKKRIPDVIKARRTGNGFHPTEKPVDLMLQLIECNIAEIILDPFAGSGTTGRAAKDLGKKCILIEREEKYCEIAANRMLQEVLI